MVSTGAFRSTKEAMAEGGAMSMVTSRRANEVGIAVVERASKIEIAVVDVELDDGNDGQEGRKMEEGKKEVVASRLRQMGEAPRGERRNSQIQHMHALAARALNIQVQTSCGIDIQPKGPFTDVVH
ncbi:hypothetical protein BKA70DRAFT_1222609 [Coprinopsis sp. MPI-PUGE-AT-0042]|nr:hypothetical protein BKA70DRAFT_1222609 [Coprinopsis sp. MPI-PUGE-AT-0042]